MSTSITSSPSSPLLVWMIGLLLIGLTATYCALALSTTGEFSLPNNVTPLIHLAQKTYLPLVDDVFLDVTDLSITNATRTVGDTVGFVTLVYTQTNRGTVDVRIELKKLPLATLPTDAIILDPTIVDVVHEQPPAYEVITGKTFAEGHDWIIPAPSTRLTATMNYQDWHLDIQVRYEYEPRLQDPTEAERMYAKHTDDVQEILTRFRTNLSL